MAHREQRMVVSIIEEHLRNRIKNGTIVEIGSYSYVLELSTREILRKNVNSTYIGVDLTEGPGVDVVMSGHLLDLPSDSVDLAISCECFEHNPDWKATLVNMKRMTKPAGMVVVTCASRGRVEHGTYRSNNPGGSPGTSAMGTEYYRNLVEADFRSDPALLQGLAAYQFAYLRCHRDLVFVGLKEGAFEFDPNNYLSNIFARIEQIPQMRARERGPLKTVARELVLNIPLGTLSFLLPEAVFQRLILPYYNGLLRLGGTRGKAWLSGS